MQSGWVKVSKNCNLVCQSNGSKYCDEAPLRVCARLELVCFLGVKFNVDPLLVVYYFLL